MFRNLSELIQDQKAEPRLWRCWFQSPGPFPYTTLAQIGNKRWESYKSVIPFLLQGSERGAQETSGSSREAARGHHGSGTTRPSSWHSTHSKGDIIHWTLVSRQAMKDQTPPSPTEVKSALWRCDHRIPHETQVFLSSGFLAVWAMAK